MKYCTTFLMILFFAFTLTAQINPDENDGEYVSFDESPALSFSVQDCGSGASFEIVDNPDSTDKVAMFTTSDCADESFRCDEEFTPINLVGRPVFYLHVKAPAAGKIIGLTLFDLNDTEKKYTVEATTTSAEWEKLEFDFSNAETGIYNGFAVHPDLGGTTTEVWYVNVVTVYRTLVYWDDLIIVDFDEHPNYMFSWDCASTTAEFEIVENPLPEGLNKSAHCGWFFSDDCEWEGCATGERLDFLDFESFPYLVIDVLAPYEGAPFMLKIENYESSTDSPIEVTGESTKAFEWEKLVFDFSGAALDKYQRVAIFPQFPGTEEEEWYFDNLRIDDGTGVKDARIIKVFDYELSAINYPNPFNPSTTIEYTLQKAEHVTLTVYDIQGRQIAKLVNDDMAAGTHHAMFDAATLPSGVYVYCIETPTQYVNNKMLLVQ